MPPFRSMACRSPTRKAVAGPTLTCAVGMETPGRFTASTGAADPRLMRCGVPGLGPSTFLEEIVRRDRLLLLAGIVGVSALAWGVVDPGVLHGHGRHRDDANGGHGRLDDAAGHVDSGVCVTDSLHVVGNDGCDDAARRRADAAVVRPSQSQNSRLALYADRHVCDWLSDRLGRI